MQKSTSFSYCFILTILSHINLIFSSPARVTLTTSSSRNSTTRPTGSHVLPDPNAVVNSPQSTSTSSDISPGEIGQNRSCSGVDGGVEDTRCWGILNIGTYLIDPIVGWNQTVPVCGIRGSDSDQNNTEKCCEPAEPWSTCFLRLTTLNPGLDCTSLGSPYCTGAPPEHVSPLVASQVHYVIKNIFSE